MAIESLIPVFRFAADVFGGIVRCPKYRAQIELLETRIVHLEKQVSENAQRAANNDLYQEKKANDLKEAAAKAEATAEKQQRELEGYRHKSQALESKLAAMNSVAIVAGNVLFLRSDVHPRVPLCPVCHSEGIIHRATPRDGKLWCYRCIRGSEHCPTALVGYLPDGITLEELSMHVLPLQER